MKKGLGVWSVFCSSCILWGATELKLDFNSLEKSDLKVQKLQVITDHNQKKVGNFTGKEYAQWKKTIPADSVGFTISMELNPRVLSGDVVTCHDENNQRAFRLNLGGGKISFTVNPTGLVNAGNYVCLPIKANTWQRVTAKFRPGVLSLEVDKKYVTCKGPERFFHSTYPITVGMYATYKTLIRPYNGLMKNLSIKFFKENELTRDEKLVNLLDTPKNFKHLAGNWKIQNGIAQPIAQKDQKWYYLQWLNTLPGKNYRVDFELSLNDRSKDFVPEAFVIVKSNSSGKNGLGFGLDRTSKPIQIKCKTFPAKERVAMSFIQSGQKKSQEWQKFTLIVQGDWFEVHAPQLAMRDLLLGFSNPKLNNLVLATNDSQARFRNLSVSPLKKAPTVAQIKINMPQQENATINNYRPTFSWEPLGLNKFDDLHYKVEISKYPFRKVIETIETDDNICRPITALTPGQYMIAINAFNCRGPLWGGKVNRVFTVKPNYSDVPYDGIKITAPITPKHFEEIRPEFTLTWQKHRNLYRAVGYLGRVQIFDYPNIHGQNSIKFKPTVDLSPGLNIFKINFYEGKRLIDSLNFEVVRTKVPHKYTIAQDGKLYCNGKLVLPFGTYRDPSDDKFQAAGLKEAQFNFSHSYAFEGGHYYKNEHLSNIFPYHFSREMLQWQINEGRKYLQFCEKNGIKAALGIRRHWVHFGKVDLIKEYVAALMGEPALLTWYLYDEADWVMAPISGLRKSYEAIKEIDPYHPVSTIFAQNSWIPRYARCCDILWSQSYGVGAQSVINSIDAMFEYLKHDQHNGLKYTINPRSCWVILSAFDQQFKKKGYKNHVPSPQQIETKQFAALTTPVTGLVYYWLPRNRYDMRKDAPEIWQAIVKSGDIARKILPYSLAPGQDLKVPSNINGIVAKVKALKSGEKLVILINTTKQERNYLLPHMPHKQITKLGGTYKLKKQGEKIEVKLNSNSGCAFLVK